MFIYRYITDNLHGFYVVYLFDLHLLQKPKDVLKSTFRQYEYGQIEKQRWEESERRKAEGRRSEKKKVEKSQNIAFFPIFCDSGGATSKAAGAEPCGGMGDENLHTIVARSRL